MKKLIKTLGLAVTAIAVAVSTAAVVMPAPKASAATNCISPTVVIRYGSSGTCVKAAQTMLNYIGRWQDYANYEWLTMDGQFGSHTRGQVYAYQRAKWSLTDDGVIGKNTWASLCQDAWSLAVHRYDLSYRMVAYNMGQTIGCPSSYYY